MNRVADCRYLSPEPLLQMPLEVSVAALEGQTMPTYSYASNNPIANIDPNGLQSVPAPTPAPAPPPSGFMPLLPPFVFDPPEHTCADGSVWTCESTICRQVSAAKKKWSCTASCNVQAIPGQAPATFPARVTGTGTGSSEADACVEAKRAATQSAPPGTYSRHCQCDCVKR